MLTGLLDRKIDEDRRIQQSAGDVKHENILRLISSTLTDNVEQVISRIVMDNIQAQVVPAISNVTSASVQRAISDNLNRALSTSIPTELRQTVPDAVNRALSHPDMLNRISDALIHPLLQAVEREFSHSLHSSLIPNFQKYAMESARNAIAETERAHNETITRLEHMRIQDSKKIDQLMGTIMSLSESMNTLVKQQSDFQEQVRQAQEEFFAGQTSAASQSRGAPEPLNHHQQHHQHQYPQHQQTPRQYQQPVPPPKTAEQLEAEEIESLLKSGKYEDGTIKVNCFCLIAAHG